MTPSTSIENVTNPSALARGAVLVCIPSVSAEALDRIRSVIAESFPSEKVLIASPEGAAEKPSSHSQVSLLPYTHPRSNFGWVLAAGDYRAAAEVALATNAEVAVLLGDQEISSSVLAALVAEIRDQRVDLVLPCYTTGPTDGLVTSALLYPLTRVLFGVEARFPLPVNIAFSRRAADRLAPVANRIATNSVPESLLWPVAEAVVTGLSVRQTDAGTRSMPQPTESDFNALFTAVAGSLFMDIEAKASFWQRRRSSFTPPAHAASAGHAYEEIEEEITAMVKNFHLAYANLQEIWSLVLPPQSLLALKRLSIAAPESFAVAPQLWARVVYDFILAFHFRTINRGHLLGSFTSLYLAWVCSYLGSVAHSTSVSSHLIAETVSAFELEKPYLLGRWRWPDRFNP